MSDNFLKINKGINFNAQNNAPSNPTNGDIYYNSTFNKFQKYEGSQWIDIGTNSHQLVQTTATAGGITNLTINDKQIQYWTGSANQTIVLPNTTLYSSTGATFEFYNASTGTLTINLFTGGLLKSLPAGGGYIVKLIDNSTSDGVWSHINSIESVTVAAGGSDGQVQFNSGGSLSGNNNLFYDYTNGYLGIHNTTPIRGLHIANEEFIIEQTAGLADFRKWNMYVGGGAGVAQDLNFRILNDLGTASSLDAMTIKGNGNVGIGTTPNASWGTGITALEIGNTPFISGSNASGLLHISSNLYYDGTNYRHMNNGFASDQYSLNGEFIWRTTSASGLADSIATSLSERMRIDSSGNVGIGGSVATVSGYTVLSVDTPANINSYFYLRTFGANRLVLKGTNSGSQTIASITNGLNLDVPAGNSISFTVNSSEAMRVDQNKRLGIGQSSPLYKLDVLGEGSRFSSTGGVDSVVAVQNTTHSAAITIQGRSSDNNGALRFVNNAFSAEYAYLSSSATVTNLFTIPDNTLAFGVAGSTYTQIFRTSGVPRYTPTTDGAVLLGESSLRWGQIYSTVGTISTSDQREKNTILNSSLGLDFINALRPVSYKFNVALNKVEKDIDGNEVITSIPGVRTHYGLISQEVKLVMDSFGLTTNDFAGWTKDQDTEYGREGLRYEEFISPLIKAVQELSTKNNALEARIAALETP